VGAAVAVNRLFMVGFLTGSRAGLSA